MADEKHTEKRSPMGKLGYAAYKATDTTMDVVASIVRVVLKIFGSAFIVILLSGMLFACIFAYYVKNCLVSEVDVSLSDYTINQASTIWYNDGSGEYKELVTLTGLETHDWVEYEQIPHYMEQAVVAIEDKDFYDHKGVDWFRTSGALIDMFFTMRKTYGGSTITQQVLKNVTGNDEVTVQRKLKEIFGALELEKRYDKKEIMEWYLNVAYFGEGCWGVQRAAHKYFGKDVSELSLAECAAIAGITNLPTYYDPFYNEENNKRRQETILREMYNQGYITYAEFKQAAAEPLYFARTPEEDTVQQIYTWYEETVIQDVITDLAKLKGISREAARTLVFNGGYQIYCCLNPDIQTAVDNIYEDLNAIPKTTGTQQLQSSIVVMDPYSGAVVALSGGVGEKDRNFPLNRATGTQRSPGSAFKPIASYGPATELGYITPNTWVRDESYITLSGTSWFPQNDGGDNYGLMTIFEALQYSLNTVAAQIVDKLTPEVCYNYLIQKLGVTSLVPDDCAYAPMALGQLTNGITVREMAAAYCSFVNDGVFTYSRTYSLVTDKQGNTVIDNSPSTVQAFSANTAHVMTYMLENAVENGTGTEDAAFLLTSDSVITEERLREAKKEVSRQSTGFINIKNTLAKEVAAAAAAESSDLEYAAQKINEIYDSLKKITPGADFYGVPASVIFKNVNSVEYDSIVDRVRTIYKGLKKKHPFLTSYEDIIACTLMAMSGKREEEVVEDCEECFSILKDKYFINNNAQTVACILSIFPGTPTEKCKKSAAVEKALKKAGVSLGDRALASVAATSMIVKDEDLNTLITDIAEISETLKSVRGLGNMGVGKNFRNLISLSIAAAAYSEAEAINIEGVAASSVVSTMFAQQLTMIVCMASSVSMATVAASSSSN